MGDLDAAISWATATRHARQRFVEAVTANELSVEELHGLMTYAPEAIQTLRLLPCIEAMPAAGGKVRSRRAIAAAGLDEAILLRDISEAQWRSLADYVGRSVDAASNPQE